MPKVNKSTKGVNRESDEVAYVTHDLGFILESNTTARANSSRVKAFDQIVSDPYKSFSVSQSNTKESKFRAKKLTNQPKASLPAYDNLPIYSKSKTRGQYKNKLVVESVSKKSIKKCTWEESSSSPTLFDSSRVLRPSAVVYDIADEGPQRKKQSSKAYCSKTWKAH